MLPLILIQLSHIFDTTKPGFNERFPLYGLISNLNTFKEGQKIINDQIKKSIKDIISEYNNFSKLDEEFWKPAPLLQKLADESSVFGEAPTQNERATKLSFKKTNMGGV